jgi:hypothetical protein
MRLFLILLGLISFTSFSQECSHLWQSDLATGTIGPKGYLGDTHAAYGIQAFLNDGTKYYVVKGRFPKARFFSVETYEGRKNGTGKSVFDSHIIPDSDSVNPFTEGVALNAEPRDYTLFIAPEGSPQFGPNQLNFTKRQRYISFYIRYYVPSFGAQVTVADLPQVEAYDLKTRQPTSCSKSWPVENFTNYPQFLGGLSDKPEGVFSFGQAKWNKGANSAVGKYAEGHSEMRFDEVALIRFKAPTFFNSFSGLGTFNSSAQVRYWSLCEKNLPNNQGLVCLADYLTPPDKNGYVTVVTGSGEDIKAEAGRRGYYFMPDMRPKNAVMILFAFRNILPSADFKQNEQYKGDYNPRMRICKESEFLEGSCEWWEKE